jgi:peptidoglycan/LPS O-acetylase OafA/YrhL
MKRLELLDYGRFIAALCVLGYHYLFNGINNGKVDSIEYIPAIIDAAKYGYLGVEFFFMISGYVIFFSANRKSAGDFLTSRAVRLFPAFWVAVLFTSAIAFFMGDSIMSVSVPQVITNLTMFPNLFGYGFVDGVYWTLQYEWKFYFAVFAALVLGMQERLRFIFMVWPVCMLLAKITGLTALPYMGDYFSYFAAGCLFAMLKEQKSVPAIASLLLCLYLCVSSTLERASLLEDIKGVDYSLAIIAAVIVSFFVLFAFINSATGSALKLPGSRLAGGLTYPVYLIHAHFGYMALNHFATDENKILVYFLCLVIVLIIAYLIHIVAEKKLATFWEDLFSRTLGAAGNIVQLRTSIIASNLYRYTLDKFR